MYLDTECARDRDLHKQRNQTAIFLFSFTLPEPLWVKNPPKKLRPEPISRCAFVFPGACFTLCRHTFLLRKGNDP